FLHNLPFYGLAVVCGDDPHVREIMPDIARPTITYGFDEGNDVRAVDVHQDGLQTHFTALRPGHAPLRVTLNLPGLRNVLNSLAAITIASDEKIADEAIVSALGKFQGVGRRFQQMGEFAWGEGTVRLVDDYGHHPREVDAIIKAARQSFPERR